MSQDWIKIEKITFEKKEVARIATILKMDRYAVIGRLARLWIYFDSHTEDGRIEGVDYVFLDDLVGKKGFCAAMESQKWIDNSNDVITLPNFERHNGETAKKRSEAARRQGKARAKTTHSSQKSVTDVTKSCDETRNQIRGEERRGEEKENSIPTNSESESTRKAQVDEILKRAARNSK